MTNPMRISMSLIFDNEVRLSDLLECYRYIELNPVRAGMVDDSADYRWSSYRDNALGQRRLVRLTPHDEYLRLGRSVSERRERYRSLFTGHEDGSLVKDIRDAVNTGLALGSDRFKDEIETNFKRQVRPAKMGRPRNPTDTNHEQKQKSLL